MSQPLPSGMTFTEEYEGVDGKSGLLGSGRIGPIDVTDGKKVYIAIGLAFAEERVGRFSVQHMQKHSSLMATLYGFECIICSKPVENYHSVHHIHV